MAGDNPLSGDPTSEVIQPKRIRANARAQTPASGVEKDQTIQRNSFTALNQSVQTLRNQGQLAEAIRELLSFEGTASSAAFDFVEVAHTDWKVKAYCLNTHRFDPEATMLANSLIAKIDTLQDYSRGYSDRLSMNQLIEMSLQEALTTGGVANELVLNRARLPEYISLFDYDSIEWRSDGRGGRYPVQRATGAAGGGGDIPLNFPTIFISELHRHVNRAYARSPLEPAVNSSWHYAEFIEEMRRSIRRHGHGRFVVTLEAEKVVASAPEDVRKDKDKLREFMEKTRNDVENALSDLEPEDIVVGFDTAEFEMHKAEGEKADYVPLVQALSGNLATSLKASPSIIGLRIEGSQSLSNTESLVFLKVAKSLHKPVETNMSRMLTLGIRLYGSESYVKFEFEPIDIRPAHELEAFKTMRQARILEKLSLGFYTDEEAAVELGHRSVPENMIGLSGTGFLIANPIDAGKANVSEGAAQQNMAPDTPQAGGGRSQ